MLLGAPGTGKTRLQSRYTLRQFVSIESENAHLMGGHKHLRLLDGTEVHLIIHELRAGRGRATMDSFTREDQHREDCQRKRLLEQSDAVMLTFNPWSKETYEWINGSVIEDILYAGQKKQLTSDIVGLLDGLAASMPQRTRSTRSAMSFSPFAKRLPRRPDEAEDSDGDSATLFSNGDEKRDYDGIDYRGELKRISIVVEGSALKKAEFMIHEKDLPSPPLQSPTPSPLAITSPMAARRKTLATITEDDEASKRSNSIAILMSKRRLPIMKHDSGVSMQSDTSRLSTYSEYAAPALAPNEVPSEPHPALRSSETVPLVNLPSLEALVRRPVSTPTEETEVPVLVVATMTDRLRDNGGTMDRQVTADQGQRLARKFGPNCAYIETSARSNANVDEAYGVIVDQVMAKRAAARRDEAARARIEAAVRATQGEGRRGRPAATTLLRPKTSQRPARTCVPSLGWLASACGGAMDKFAGALVVKAPGAGRDDGSVPMEVVEVGEDVWGEKVEVKRRSQMPTAPPKGDGGTVRHPDKRQSKQLPKTPTAGWQLIDDKTNAGSALGMRTMSHNAAQDMVFDAVDEDEEQKLAPDPMPAVPPATYNPFGKEEFEWPAKMVFVTALGPPETLSTETTKAQRRRTDAMPSLSRKSSESVRKASLQRSRSLDRSMRHKRSKPDLAAELDVEQKTLIDLVRSRSRSRSRTRHADPRKSNISEVAPALPPFSFDNNNTVDDNRGAGPLWPVLSSGPEKYGDAGSEHMTAFMTHQVSRDSFIMMLSPTAASRTLGDFTKQAHSRSARKSAVSVAPEQPGKSRPASEVPEAPRSLDEDESDRITRERTVAAQETDADVSETSSTILLDPTSGSERRAITPPPPPRTKDTPATSPPRPIEHKSSLLTSLPQTAIKTPDGQGAAVTTREVRGGEFMGTDEERHRRSPDNPRRARPKPDDGTRGPSARPLPPPPKGTARTSSANRPLSAWV